MRRLRGFALFGASLIALSAPAETLDAHPRPDWARPWVSVNGAWRFDFDPGDSGVKDRWFESHTYAKQITVPFPWQSPLSGIHDTAYQGAAWYERDVTIPADMAGRRVFLVFGAVDWCATVWVNGQQIADHEGGYSPFEVELTGKVKPGQSARVAVRAYDVTDPETPTGKQTGWYTPSGGIWQTVYLEARGASYLREARITPDIDHAQAVVRGVLDAAEPGAYEVKVSSRHGEQRCVANVRVNCRKGPNPFQLTLPVPNPALWTPDSPNLYDTTLELRRGKTTLDSVETYFGMRKISRGTYGGTGHEYILLNNKPIYLRGALHQSFNPQGVYTHPDDAYIRRDYERAKEFGLNFIRIHIKVDEPRALYWADKLGVMLMCDMPCFSRKTEKAKANWEQTLRATVARDFNHPSVIAWCDFNETWGIGDGGYDRPTQEWVRDMFRLTKSLDPSRLAEDNSPCTYDHTVTDINSWHFYIDDYARAKKHIEEVVAKTAPGSPFNYAPGWTQETAPLINSEYGGVGAGSGDRDVSWVFLFLTNLLRKQNPVCGYVYTELEDIEWEHNGFMNYDRSLKDFGYPAGITLAQLQHDEFPVLDGPPYRVVAPGESVSIPLLLSHWSERENLTLRVSVDGATIDGKPWSQWIPAEERPVSAAPFTVAPAGAFNMVAPNACGIANVIVEVLSNGKRCAANYCVIDIRNGDAWKADNQYALSFPVDAYSAYRFNGAKVFFSDHSGKLYGHNKGFVEYKLQLPRDLRASNVQSCKLVFEAAAKANDERLDWPARTNPQDYPQTDAHAWPTEAQVRLNGVTVTRQRLENDFADARGVLSHEAQYQHGSHGCVVTAPIEGEALKSLKSALGRHEPVTLRFEVPDDATQAGGLALYGKEMGSWPSDPTLVFTLAPRTAQPKGKAGVVDRAAVRKVSVLPRAPEGAMWRYTTENPGEHWMDASFDDSTWARGKSGFGSTGTPGAHLGTKWETSDIWLRIPIRVPRDFVDAPAVVALHHDEDAQVFVNGAPLLKRKGYTSSYESIVLTPQQKALFKADAVNTIAVHCHQTGGGQYIDLSIETIEAD